jgi:hypothetical protein
MRTRVLCTCALVIALALASTALAQEDVDEALVADTPPPASVDADAGVPTRLFVRVVEPADEDVELPSGTTSISVRGQTLPGAVVSVDGVLTTVDELGGFNSVVELMAGVNDIDVVASTVDGAQADTTVIVISGDD